MGGEISDTEELFGHVGRQSLVLPLIYRVLLLGQRRWFTVPYQSDGYGYL